MSELDAAAKPVSDFDQEADVLFVARPVGITVHHLKSTDRAGVCGVPYGYGEQIAHGHVASHPGRLILAREDLRAAFTDRTTDL